MRTVVIQSHRSPLPLPWLARCIDSVQAWSRHYGYEYQWLGDELFATVPQALREKTQAHLPMTADLARLRVLQQALRSGYDRAVWVDADVLVFAPERLRLNPVDHCFGREVWVQMHQGASRGAHNQSQGSLRTYRKIHNAFMSFQSDSSVLPFYADTAQRLLEQHQGTALAPQFVGPKLLTALHNVAQFNVLESAAMLPPLVAKAIAEDRTDAHKDNPLHRFASESAARPAALNLCSSLQTELTDYGVDPAALIDQLLADDIPWPGISQA